MVYKETKEAKGLKVIKAVRVQLEFKVTKVVRDLKAIREAKAQ